MPPPSLWPPTGGLGFLPPRRQFLGAVLCLAVAGGGFVFAPRNAAAGGKPSPLAKWWEVKRRHLAQGTADGAGGAWEAAVRLLSRTPMRQRPFLAQGLFNRPPYHFDTGDSWLTPREFLAGGGDCEDFAIAKLLALRESGVAEADLALLALVRPADRRGHMVCGMRCRDEEMVLDNSSDSVGRITDYPGWIRVFTITADDIRYDAAGVEWVRGQGGR